MVRVYCTFQSSLKSGISCAGEDHDTDWHTELKTAIAAEQEADAAAMGGGGIAGFKPSASSAWRDADFRTQQGMQYGGYSNQPDINEQGWLPR